APEPAPRKKTVEKPEAPARAPVAPARKTADSGPAVPKARALSVAAVREAVAGPPVIKPVRVVEEAKWVPPISARLAARDVRSALAKKVPSRPWSSQSGANGWMPAARVYSESEEEEGKETESFPTSYAGKIAEPETDTEELGEALSGV